jgi:uncharacterized membrane protein YbhN (UPF0104 family)
MNRPHMSRLADPARRGFLRRHAVKLIASVAITAGIIYTAAKGDIKLIPDSGDFGAVRWWTLGLYFAIAFAMTWFRSVRWRFLLRPILEVPKLRLFAVSCAGFAAILLLPFRLGEFARPYMLRTRDEDRRPGEPVLTMAAATSSIVAERVIDGLFLSVVLAVVLVLVPTVHPLPEHVVGLKVMGKSVAMSTVRASGFSMLGVFTAGLATILVFYFARGWARRAVLLVVGKVSMRLADKIATLAEHLADGLHVFGRARDVAGFLAETTAYWGLNALGLWVLAIGCGVVHADGSAPTFFEACGLMGLLGCAILIPGPPGLLGVFQAGIYAGMTFYYPGHIVSGPGAAYVFLLYVSQVILHLSTATWGLWHEGGTRQLRSALEAPPLTGDASASMPGS